MRRGTESASAEGEAQAVLSQPLTLASPVYCPLSAVLAVQGAWQAEADEASEAARAQQELSILKDVAEAPRLSWA